MTELKKKIADAHTIVVKVGTSTITHANGSMDFHLIEKLVRVLADLRSDGRNIVLVTSGAIGVGRFRMGMKERPTALPEKQALAAIGQVSLMYIYSKFFGEYDQVAAQVLITGDVVDDELKKRNTYNTFCTLMDYGVIPIVNENDTVATEEIEPFFGDNDTLSAVVAELINADLLILISDIEGLYDKNPKCHEDANLIPIIYDICSQVIDGVEGTDNDLGTGGMKTKIEAARVCCRAGIPMIITNGDNPDHIYEILEGEDVGTLFVPYNKESIT
ncbi:MAG TPA: glutamate 5-kinase [Clostridia bacterium]|nr:glutamate 5-kinase [Clostridia bacterium]